VVYISAWNTVVWSPRLKLCPLLEPHLYTPAPIYICQGIWLWVVRGTHISVASCLAPPVGWVHAPFSKNFGVVKVNGFWFPLLCTHYSVVPCMGLHLSHNMKRSKYKEDLHYSHWGHLHRSCSSQTGCLCNLLISILLTLYLTLGHQTI